MPHRVKKMLNRVNKRPNRVEEDATPSEDNTTQSEPNAKQERTKCQAAWTKCHTEWTKSQNTAVEQNAPNRVTKCQSDRNKMPKFRLGGKNARQEWKAKNDSYGVGRGTRKKMPFFLPLKSRKKNVPKHLSQVKFALDPFNSALNRNQNLTLILKVFFFFVLHAGGAAVLMA